MPVGDDHQRLALGHLRRDHSLVDGISVLQSLGQDHLVHVLQAPLAPRGDPGLLAHQTFVVLRGLLLLFNLQFFLLVAARLRVVPRHLERVHVGHAVDLYAAAQLRLLGLAVPEKN